MQRGMDALLIQFVEESGMLIAHASPTRAICYGGVEVVLDAHSAIFYHNGVRRLRANQASSG